MPEEDRIPARRIYKRPVLVQSNCAIVLLAKNAGHSFIDKEDAGIAAKYNWHRGTDGYAFTTLPGERKKTSLQRVLMGFPAAKIDHIDHDPLNNQRSSNLRLCSTQENSMNTSSRKNSSSKFLGVYFEKSRGKWGVGIKAKGEKRKFVGRFNDEKIAALAYNVYTHSKFGEFANLNKL